VKCASGVARSGIYALSVVDAPIVEIAIARKNLTASAKKMIQTKAPAR
jgi:hypothetical protein